MNSLQYKVYKSYLKYESRDPNRKDGIKVYGLIAIVLFIVSIVLIETNIIQNQTLLYGLIGYFVGLVMMGIALFQQTTKQRPYIREIINWDKLKENLQKE